MKKQVQKFANDPVIYYLHKNRHFISKLQQRMEEKKSVSENIKEFAG